MYVVIFRSQVKADVQRFIMGQIDNDAFTEAGLSGGLLDYVRGSDEGAKASVCVWESKADAERASALPAHQRAVRMAPYFYDWWTLETYGE